MMAPTSSCALFAVLVLAAAVCAPAQAQEALGCLIEPHQVAEVGSPVIGIIDTIAVERGDRVAKGQVIATLRADVERAAVGVASTKAMVAAEVQAAQANHDLARQKFLRAQELVARKFISTQALDQARAEADVARQRLAQAQDQRRIWSRELQLAEAQLGQRTIRSPANGVIAERYMSPGERVEEKPVVRVATLDPLRVEVVMPAQLFGSIRLGATLMVQPDMPNAVPREARVVLVDQLIDGPSNTFRARLELPNSNYEVPAGVRCKIELGAEVPTLRIDRNIPQMRPDGVR
ncbi:MAG: efflux RND transporter periplasmic adaptor subunit [Betaproteobacteria bacterium]|nr:efflux RND transporter periplasmic adaptor subunit [Betaproteobacteria bacterium]